MKRFFKYLAIFILTVFVLLCVLMVFASYMFDVKLQEALSYANHRQHLVQLKYVPVSSSILDKVGRLTVTIPKSKAGPLVAAFDVKTSFNFSSFDVKFAKVDNAGNIDSILRENGLPLIGLKGAASLSLFQMKVHGAVKTTAFTLPLEDGSCRIGESSVYVSSRSTRNFDVGFSSAGVKCQSDLTYAGRDAYRLEFLNLKVKASPSIVNRKPELDKIAVFFDSLKGQASTIYLIGFKPTDDVKDPTLADSFDIENFFVTLSLSGKNSSSLKSLFSEGKADVYFAFPFIKEGKELPYSRIENFSYKLSFGSFDLQKLMDALKEGHDSIGPLLNSVSNPLKLNIDSLSLNYQGGQFNLSGFAYPYIDKNTGKISSVDAKLKASADIGVVDSLIEEQYKDALAENVRQGTILKTSRNYETTLEIKGKDVSLNGISLNESDVNGD